MNFVLSNPMNSIKFEVSPLDLPDKMRWVRAVDVCSSLNYGWRLPTVEELKIMYTDLHVLGNGNFLNKMYWSSTRNGLNNVWGVFFKCGNAYCGSENYFCRVRAVRDLD